MLRNIGKGKTFLVYSINIVDPSNWLPVCRKAELVPANTFIQQRTTWLMDVSPYIYMSNAKDKEKKTTTTRKCRI